MNADDPLDRLDERISRRLEEMFGQSIPGRTPGGSVPPGVYDLGDPGDPAEVFVPNVSGAIFSPGDRYTAAPQRCENCAHFVEVSSVGPGFDFDGACLRYPPTWRGFPPVRGDDRCGEFAPVKSA